MNCIALLHGINISGKNRITMPELQPKWTYEIFLDHVVPENRSHVEETFGTALNNRTNWDFTLPKRKDRESEWK